MGRGKVADFGIAKAAASTTITRTGGMLGTPYYNQWFADNSPIEKSSPDVGSGTSSPVKVKLTQTFKDGTFKSRDTYFVYEDGSWKHRFSPDELKLFMAGTSYEEFVKAQKGSSPERSTKAPESSQEATAVESAIRGHYGAIGSGDFEKAYSYFGPTLRSHSDKADRISNEKANKITGSTINSLKVTKISGDTATADVDVSFKDKSGTSRFSITWDLVKEGGVWKLDSQESGKRVS